MKKIFITGGTSGVGAAIVRKFNSAKWKIYFSYFENKKSALKIEKKYKNAKKIDLNLESINSMNKLNSKIKDKLDCLVLNAADTLFINNKDYKKLTPDLFEKYLKINLSSQYRIIYNLIDRLKNNSNIIFISSIASKNGVGSNVAYSASKAGLNNLAKSLSKILGNKVQINSIAPGLMETNFTKKFSSKYFANYKKKTPTKRLTKPDEIAEVTYAISVNFKNFTGQTIFVDGGAS